MTTFKVYTLQPPIPLQDQKYQNLFSYHVSSTKSPPTVGIYCKSLFHPKILVFQKSRDSLLVGSSAGCAFHCDAHLGDR